jgi:lysine N6-hydroxylase
MPLQTFLKDEIQKLKIKPHQIKNIFFLMNPEIIYDIVGIGIGPFNLSLAAMCDEVPELNCIFFDLAPGFEWHPGMMLPAAKLQVPFFADLTTIVNPRSKYTFLNFLYEINSMIRFGNLATDSTYRQQYNDYCQWVASELSSLRFNSRVVRVDHKEADDIYVVTVMDILTEQFKTYHTKHIVIGIGTEPSIPAFMETVEHPNIIHSGEYLPSKEKLLKQSSVTVIGSGQSAGEIFYELLFERGIKHLSWFTRSERIYPMEYTKLSLEMTSPDYIRHFFHLSPEKRAEVLKSHDQLYKGINADLISDIYEALYLKQFDRHTPDIKIHPSVELKGVNTTGGKIDLELYHTQLEQSFNHKTNALILATGYRPTFPSFITHIKDCIQFFDDGNLNVNFNYSIDKEGKQIFVQNAELHTHGFSAPDLGLGPYRNATILNTILGYERFRIEENVTFQSFGLQ